MIVTIHMRNVKFVVTNKNVKNMFANLVAYNTVEGKTSSSSVEFTGNQNDMIQLTIGTRKWFFDHQGNLLSSTENQTCINTNNQKGTCASFNSDNSIPNPHFTPYD